MAKRVNTIEQLRQELAGWEAKLAALQKQRATVEKVLRSIDTQIAALTGEAAPAREGKRKKGKRGRKAVATIQKKAKRGRPAKKQVKGKGKRGGRRTEGKPLADHVMVVLKGKKDGMKVKDIAEAVQQAGYQTTSKNFSAVVNVLLSKDKRFEKVGPGVYKVA